MSHEPTIIPPRKHSVKGGITIAGKGFCMGAADVVPGVSGGTMAFILGIYQRLLEAIRSFDVCLLALLKERRIGSAIHHTDLYFLLFLGAGIFAALMFFTRVVPLPELIRTQPELVYGLFFGLVVASILVLLDEVEHIGLKGMVALLLGAAAGLVIVNLVPMETPNATWFIFGSGALAICAMILPGISGSFILLILKKYAFVFDAIGRLELSVLLPFALGAATGIMLFSRFLVWLLHHYYRVTLLTITGLLAGSLWLIWPFQERVFETVRNKPRLISSTPIWPPSWDQTAWASLGLMLLGLGLVFALHWLSRRRPMPG